MNILTYQFQNCHFFSNNKATFFHFQCVKHYDYLTKDLNRRLLLQNYKVFATNHRYLVLFLLVSLVLLVFAGMVFVALRMYFITTRNSDRTELPIVVTSIVGITSVLLLIPCFLCCVPYCRKKVYNACNSCKRHAQFYIQLLEVFLDRFELNLYER